MWMANILKLTSEVAPDDYAHGWVIAFYTPDTHLVKGSTIDHVRMAAE